VERDVGAFEQRFRAAAERDLGEADHVGSIGKARIVRATVGQSGENSTRFEFAQPGLARPAASRAGGVK
ncbi:MAG TPA: hypothetical protein VEM33_01765, partial [Burkholderiales bacterium]|nr:hypothetical protein [Burkholderiales bacterium]